MEAAAALRRIAHLIERELGSSRRSSAYRKAAAAVDELSAEQLSDLVSLGQVQQLPGVGSSTAQVIKEAVEGKAPKRLADLEAEDSVLPTLEGDALALREALRGDCHTHSEWSDGKTSIEEMADAARDAGHGYIVLTDHSPRLQVARGLSAERLEAQLDELEELNRRLAPFRILTGIETDILPDGSLDQRPDLLARLDVVVASVHSKLQMPRKEMTERMLAAIRNPNMDILGHCTGRMRKSNGDRPESEFDAAAVFEACAEYGKAVEINSRPDRRDPPRRLMAEARDAGCLFAIDSDGHAPGELDWLALGCDRAAGCGITAERVVNTMEADALAEWATGHGEVQS